MELWVLPTFKCSTFQQHLAKNMSTFIGQEMWKLGQLGFQNQWNRKNDCKDDKFCRFTRIM